MIDKFKSEIKHNGIVYLISDGTYIKIGYTKTSIKNRIEAMQTGNANKLEVIAFSKVPKCEKIEKYIHYRYKDYRHRREWFKFTTDGHIFDIVNILRKAEKETGYAESLIKEYDTFFNTAKKQSAHSARSAGIV